MTKHVHEHPDIKIRGAIIVCSDRASKGEYKDKVIPTAEELFASLNWQLTFKAIVPDNIEDIHNAIKNALEKQVHVIFTAGGTGVSPRDVTPEAVAPFIYRNIPGIAEYIRFISWQKTPHALLSRGVSGITKEGVLIITLPGSPKAVQEIIPAISKAIIHAIPIIQGYKIE